MPPPHLGQREKVPSKVTQEYKLTIQVVIQFTFLLTQTGERQRNTSLLKTFNFLAFVSIFTCLCKSMSCVCMCPLRLKRMSDHTERELQVVVNQTWVL